MYLVDYHTHSAYSFDGCESLEAMCQQAMAAGLQELAVTDHMDIYRGLPYGHMLSFDPVEESAPLQRLGVGVTGGTERTEEIRKTDRTEKTGKIERIGETVGAGTSGRTGEIVDAGTDRITGETVDVGTDRITGETVDVGTSGRTGGAGDAAGTGFCPCGGTDPAQLASAYAGQVPYFSHEDRWLGQVLMHKHDYHMDVQGLYRELASVKARYAGRLKVVMGSELGQPQVNPDAAAAFLRDYPLDFVIGSVHNMALELDPFYFDFKYVDTKKMYEAYLDALIEMAGTCDFDICGHVTYPLRYAFEYSARMPEMKPFEERLRALFGLLIEGGRGIEVNVSGYYKAMGCPMPDLPVLKLYRACGGEYVTIGSDAHKKAWIGTYQKEGHALLEAAGFKYLTTYENRKPNLIRL